MRPQPPTISWQLLSSHILVGAFPPMPVLPIKSTTWARQGADSVPLIGLDDKRQITSVLVEALGDDKEGLVVGMQLIYTGLTDRCLPELAHREKDLFSDFHFTYTYNHWADENTNFELFEEIIKADVDGGGVLKPKLRARTTQYLQKEYSQQLREGKAPHEVALDLSLGNMKVRQLYWIGEVFMEFKANIEARTKGWGLTGVPRVFSEEMQRAARELHLKGLLFPNGRVEFTPQSTGAEETPGADTDDYEPQLEDFVEGEDQGAAADYRCAEQYTEL
eukprot:gene23742-28781_t